MRYKYSSSDDSMYTLLNDESEEAKSSNCDSINISKIERGNAKKAVNLCPYDAEDGFNINIAFTIPRKLFKGLPYVYFIILLFYM